MKLYNLALRADEFRNKGSFKEIFGVSKDYYPFMKRNNITYLQLKILRLLKEKDMKKIKYLQHFVSYGESISDLEEISNYISLNRFIKYSKMHHRKVKTYLYKDYLRFAKILGLDLKDNRYAFPKNLDESKQQNNCVRTYAEKYADGTCDIYFMRDIKSQDKSLVTVEVKNNAIVQSRTKNNNDPNEKQLKFLYSWENAILKGAA